MIKTTLCQASWVTMPCSGFFVLKNRVKEECLKASNQRVFLQLKKCGWILEANRCENPFPVQVDMGWLSAIHSEKFVLKQFLPYVNIIGHIYTNSSCTAGSTQTMWYFMCLYTHGVAYCSHGHKEQDNLLTRLSTPRWRATGKCRLLRESQSAPGTSPTLG